MIDKGGTATMTTIQTKQHKKGQVDREHMIDKGGTATITTIQTKQRRNERRKTDGLYHLNADSR